MIFTNLPAHFPPYVRFIAKHCALRIKLIIHENRYVRNWKVKVTLRISCVHFWTKAFIW